MKRKPPSKHDLVKIINKMEEEAVIMYSHLTNDRPNALLDRHTESRPAYERLQNLAYIARSYFPAELPKSRNGWDFE